MRILSIGKVGEDVRKWQEFLISEGFIDLKVTGIFESPTLFATLQWKANNNLGDTGDVSPIIWPYVERVLYEKQTEAKYPLAWGKRVSEAFRKRFLEIANTLIVDPGDLMACIAFETGETFSPSVRNAAGSGATGLIQFMPSTAQALGTTTNALAKMSAVKQLDYVELYFYPSRGRLKNLEDVYMAILWPIAVGKSLSYVLFDKNDARFPKRYIQNAGLDLNKDGKITKAEAAKKVKDKLTKGLRPENVYYV